MLNTPRRFVGIALLAIGAAFMWIGHRLGCAGAWLADVDHIWHQREAQRQQFLAECARRPYTGPHGPTT